MPAEREGELRAKLESVGARGVEIERDSEQVVVGFTLDSGSHEAARRLGETILNECGIWPGGIVRTERLPGSPAV